MCAGGGGGRVVYSSSCTPITTKGPTQARPTIITCWPQRDLGLISTYSCAVQHLVNLVKFLQSLSQLICSPVRHCHFILEPHTLHLIHSLQGWEPFLREKFTLIIFVHYITIETLMRKYRISTV